MTLGTILWIASLAVALAWLAFCAWAITRLLKAWWQFLFEHAERPTYFGVVKGQTEYVSIASPHPLPENLSMDHVFSLPDPLYFEFGRTPEEALTRLKASVEG